MRSNPRTAFVLDALPALGGGEKVVFAALEAVPDAEIFTLIYNRPIFAHTPLAGRHVHTSPLNRLPLAHSQHRWLLPLMPLAIEHLDLSAYDRVVSFSYAVAHGAHARHDATHLAYTYTPMRYAWRDLNINGTHTRKPPLLDWLMRSFKQWDLKAAARVHRFAAISQAVSQRIASAYHRPATVIHPPVEVERFAPAAARDDYYLTVTRLVPHKRVDLLVQACTQLGLRLLVVGDGPELRHLQQLAGPTIQFTGFVPDLAGADLLSRARGFLCATEEDFGIAIVEAQAAGCPVLAYGRGGALETVQAGVTGNFFSEQSVECLVEALQRFERTHASFQTGAMVQQAQRYNTERFKREFLEFVAHE